MKYGRILLLALAVATAVVVGGGADVARSSPDTNITLVEVKILGADLDGNANTIEIPMCGDTLNIAKAYPSARIVKKIKITVPVAITVRVSGEFAPPEGTTWHCMASFAAGADALADQGCTVGSRDYTVVGGTFRGLPNCQWSHTTETGVANKVVMPWATESKCERFVNESTIAAAGAAFRAGGAAPGCRVTEQTPAAWLPAPVPNPYDLGDCILDWHQHFVVVTSGTIELTVVDELELKPPDIPVGKYDMSEDIEVMPVGDTDPDTSDNALTKSFELNIVSAAPVGGLAELPGAAGSSGPNHVLLGGLAAAALVALGAGGWYARRRWVR